MMAESYRPSCGTEGADFQERWCCVCKRDAAFQATFDSPYGPEDGCQIVADTFAYELGDPKYPKEWIYDKDGEPVCTAFEHVDSPEKKYRCTKTADLFGEP